MPHVFHFRPRQRIRDKSSLARVADAAVLASIGRAQRRLPPNGCPFCAKIETPEAVEHPQVLGERDGYLWLNGVGAMTQGYSLLIPRHHARSMAEMGTTPFELADEIRSVLCQHLKADSTCLVAEHGSSADEVNSGSCVTHAHLHFFVMSKTLASAVLQRAEEQLGTGRTHTGSDLVQFADMPYHLLSAEPGMYKLWHEHRRRPRQFLRRIVAQELSAQGDSSVQFDWRLAPYASEMSRTLRDYRGKWGNAC